MPVSELVSRRITTRASSIDDRLKLICGRLASSVSLVSAGKKPRGLPIESLVRDFANLDRDTFFG